MVILLMTAGTLGLAALPECKSEAGLDIQSQQGAPAIRASTEHDSSEAPEVTRTKVETEGRSGDERGLVHT